MKKIIIVSFVVFSMMFFAQAQNNSQAIGVRLGGGDISGGELSYQTAVSRQNRIEFDLGFGSSDVHDRIFLSGIYHWGWNIEQGLNWYIGPGLGAGFYSYDSANDGLNIAAGGQIGLEYDFNKVQDVPILLSADARPMFDLLGDETGLGWGVALGVRYIF